MKVSIKYSQQKYTITSDVLKMLSVRAYNVIEAIELFNKELIKLISDIENIEHIHLDNLRDFIIKDDLSNNTITFVFDQDSWDNYKMSLSLRQDGKDLLSEMEKRILDKDKITTVESNTFFTRMMSGDLLVESQLTGDVLVADLENADPNSPFYNKKIVFTGVLDNISRVTAADIVKSMGADINTSISRLTDFVIVGSDAGPSKLRKIEECNANGANIKIIYETEFLKMIQ